MNSDTEHLKVIEALVALGFPVREKQNPDGEVLFTRSLSSDEMVIYRDLINPERSKELAARNILNALSIKDKTIEDIENMLPIIEITEEDIVGMTFEDSKVLLNVLLNNVNELNGICKDLMKFVNLSLSTYHKDKKDK